MKHVRLHPLSLAAGAAGGLLLVFALGLAPQENGSVGRYQAEISDDGQTVVLVDTRTGKSWMRTESGRALSGAEFRPLGAPK